MLVKRPATATFNPPPHRLLLVPSDRVELTDHVTEKETAGFLWEVGQFSVRCRTGMQTSPSDGLARNERECRKKTGVWPGRRRCQDRGMRLQWSHLKRAFHRLDWECEGRDGGAPGCVVARRALHTTRRRATGANGLRAAEPGGVH